MAVKDVVTSEDRRAGGLWVDVDFAVNVTATVTVPEVVAVPAHGKVAEIVAVPAHEVETLVLSFRDKQGGGSKTGAVESTIAARGKFIAKMGLTGFKPVALTGGKKVVKYTVGSTNVYVSPLLDDNAQCRACGATHDDPHPWCPACNGTRSVGVVEMDLDDLLK